MRSIVLALALIVVLAQRRTGGEGVSAVPPLLDRVTPPPPNGWSNVAPKIEEADEKEWDAEEPESLQEEDDETPLHAVVGMLKGDNTGNFRDFIKEVLTWKPADFEGAEHPKEGSKFGGPPMAREFGQKQNNAGFGEWRHGAFGFKGGSKKGFGIDGWKRPDAGAFGPAFKGKKGGFRFGGNVGTKIQNWMQSRQPEARQQMLRSIGAQWRSTCSAPASAHGNSFGFPRFTSKSNEQGFKSSNPWLGERPQFDRKLDNFGAHDNFKGFQFDKKMGKHEGFKGFQFDGKMGKFGPHDGFWGEGKKGEKRGFEGEWGDAKEFKKADKHAAESRKRDRGFQGKVDDAKQFKQYPNGKFQEVNVKGSLVKKFDNRGEEKRGHYQKEDKKGSRKDGKEFEEKRGKFGKKEDKKKEGQVKIDKKEEKRGHSKKDDKQKGKEDKKEGKRGYDKKEDKQKEEKRRDGHDQKEGKKKGSVDNSEGRETGNKEEQARGQHKKEDKEEGRKGNNNEPKRDEGKKADLKQPGRT